MNYILDFRFYILNYMGLHFSWTFAIYQLPASTVGIYLILFIYLITLFVSYNALVAYLIYLLSFKRKIHIYKRNSNDL